MNEFNDLFFKKIDEIDDLIVIEGRNLNFIIRKFNLESPKSTFTINMEKIKSYKVIKNFPSRLN